MRLVLIGLAGAAGALSRYGIGQAIGPRSFPWATLGINVVGAFVLGVVLGGPGVDRWSTTVTATGRRRLPRRVHHVLDVRLRDHGDAPRRPRRRPRSGYVALSLALGLGASALGFVVGRAAVT